jgi:hypothetical protein
VAKFETIAACTGTGLGMLNSGLGVFIAWRAVRESARTRQRELRGQLRDVLRRNSQRLRCLRSGDYSPDVPKAVQNAGDKLVHIREECLKSPSDAHLRHLQTRLTDIAGRWYASAQLPQMAGSLDEAAKLLAVNGSGLDRAVTEARTLAKHISAHRQKWITALSQGISSSRSSRESSSSGRRRSAGSDRGAYDYDARYTI